MLNILYKDPSWHLQFHGSGLGILLFKLLPMSSVEPKEPYHVDDKFLPRRGLLREDPPEEWVRGLLRTG